MSFAWLLLRGDAAGQEGHAEERQKSGSHVLSFGYFNGTDTRLAEHFSLRRSAQARPHAGGHATADAFCAVGRADRHVAVAFDFHGYFFNNSAMAQPSELPTSM